MVDHLHSKGAVGAFCGAERRAVIDVGTNSVKLLVADVGCSVKPVLKLCLQTGLGQGALLLGPPSEDSGAGSATPQPACVLQDTCST